LRRRHATGTGGADPRAGARGARRGGRDGDDDPRCAGPGPVEVRQGLRHEVRPQERQARARAHRRLPGRSGLIDGGLLGSFSTPDLARTKKAIKALDVDGPFVDLLGLKLPWAAGVFSESGAIAALKEPTAPSTDQAFPLLPAAFKPPIPATNRGLFGYAFDASTSPKALDLIHVRAGTLGPNGDWVDGEVTPIERLAQTFGQEPANATEWYFPAKLTIDVDAANALTRNAQTSYLKLRPWHRRGVDLPLYALQTDLTHGRVLRGARRFIAGSKVPRSRSVLVDASATESHLDPLTAAPDRNRFLQTVVPFLGKLPTSAP
jgi:hypothetical protein